MFKNIFIFIGLIFFISSCSMTPAKKDVKFNYKLDAKYNSNIGNKDKKSPYKTQWWKKFNDEKLNSLIDEVVKNNLDLKLAFGNINILRVQYQLSKVSQMPVVTASAGANIARSPMTSMSYGASGPTTSTSAEVNDSYSLQMNAMFELDLFDKYGALGRSALNNLKSSEADYKKVYFMIISQTIIIYFDIKVTKQTIELNKSIIESYESELETQRSRYEAGIGSSFNVDSLEQTIASNKSSLESLEKDLKIKKYNLKVLLGKYPKDDEIFDQKTEGVITKLEDVSIGVPSELLKNRFDIISSKRKLDSAREQIGYKKADRFPTISLSAAIGYMNIFDLDKFFDSDFITMSGGVNINQTVFSYGSKKAAYEQAVEQYNLSLLNYKKTILNAFNEVESILVAIESLKKQQNYLKRSLEFSKRSYDEAQRRYVGGVGEYKTLLDLRKSKSSIEIALLNIEKGIIVNYVSLYKALGKR